MLYIYRRAKSTSARDLAEAIMLQGTPARRTQGNSPGFRNLQPTDKVVCWGDHFAAPAGIKTLNNTPGISKFAEAQALKAAGVSTIEVSREKPRVAAARPPFVENQYAVPYGGRIAFANAVQLRDNLVQFINAEQQRKQAWERQPAVPAQDWLARRNNHVGGSDLLNAPDAPDYYSKKENIVEEYRLHMFLGKSIRAGKKVQKQTRPDGRTPPHAWIRSFDAGWVIDYNGFESTKAMRELAAAALKALKLDFGAVDMGKRADGSLLVLEVNRAPGIENNTTATYATKIIAWSKE